ncbi:MAG TPA: hypothetical protein VNX21_08665, partial [Candidatus Thermoplasmatota archaeon]|nr:hypothetical protein [Candidatus Thermoplasmatota archaeon]
GWADVPAPAQPGAYEFFCVFHGGMRGTLTVTAAPATPADGEPATGREASEGGDARTPLAPWAALAALAGVALLRRRA